LRDPLQLIEDVRRLNTKGADVVVASACVQMPSLAAIPHIENMLGIRTVSTAVCTTRSMLDRLGLEPIVPAAGALLAGSRSAEQTSDEDAKRILSLAADGFGPKPQSFLSCYVPMIMALSRSIVLDRSVMDISPAGRILSSGQSHYRMPKPNVDGNKAR
jgi:hypothetical protein